MADPINLIGNSAIEQGKTYRQTILWPGDVSDHIPSAICRDNYKEKGGLEVFAFGFLPLTYPVVNSKGVDCTAIILTLTDEIAAEIPYTKYQGDPSRLKIPSCYVWDLLLENPADGSVIGTEAGFVQVKPLVT